MEKQFRIIRCPFCRNKEDNMITLSAMDPLTEFAMLRCHNCGHLFEVSYDEMLPCIR